MPGVPEHGGSQYGLAPRAVPAAPGALWFVCVETNKPMDTKFHRHW
jgi:hypothetical protein